MIDTLKNNNTKYYTCCNACIMGPRSHKASYKKWNRICRLLWRSPRSSLRVPSSHYHDITPSTSPLAFCPNKITHFFGKKKKKKRHKDRDRETETERQRQRDRGTERDRDRDRQRQIQIQRDRDRGIEGDRQTESFIVLKELAHLLNKSFI